MAVHRVASTLLALWLLATANGAPLTSPSSSPPSSTVDIWQSSPHIAWSRRTFAVGDGQSSIRSDIRSVVARRDHLRPGIVAELVVSWAVTDDELRARTASQYLLQWEAEAALRYYGHLSDPTTGRSVPLIGRRYRWRYSHEVVFEVPDSFAWPRQAAGALALELAAVHGQTVVASHNVMLRPVATPRSALALCVKPLYSDVTPATIAILREWREHHALLGVEVVHLSARNASWADYVATTNARTGRRDTFTHLPAFDPSSPFGFHDEQITVNDCYARHRAASEWLGVIDLDEYLALDASATWSAATVLHELRSLPATVTSAELKYAWLTIEHGHVATTDLQRALPGLSDAEARAIVQLKQTVAKEYYDYDCGGCYFFKSIHRTADVLSGSIHTAARTRDMGPVDEATIGEFDPRVRSLAYTPGKLHIHHVRATSSMLDAATFEPLPLGPGIVAAWARLARALGMV